MIRLSAYDFGVLAICAIRYCFGRQTYMPDTIRQIVRPKLKYLSDNDLQVMINDCEWQRKENLYGNEHIDKPRWLVWEEELLKEKERRAKELTEYKELFFEEEK